MNQQIGLQVGTWANRSGADQIQVRESAVGDYGCASGMTFAAAFDALWASCRTPGGWYQLHERTILSSDQDWLDATAPVAVAPPAPEDRT